MTRRWLLLGVLALAAAPASAADPSLPPGALLRLGSPWFHHGTAVLGLAFSPDGATLFTVDANRLSRAWDVASGRETRRPEPLPFAVNAIALSSDGKTLALTHDRTVRIRDVATGKERSVRESRGPAVFGVAFSPDGKSLACGEEPGVVTLFDAASGRELSTLPGHKGGVRCVAWSPDGKLVASGGEDRVVRLWDWSAEKEVKSFDGFDGGVTGVAFHPDGKRLAAACQSGPARLIDRDTGRVEKLPLPGESEATSVAFSPDGKLLALGGGNRRVHLRKLADGKEPARPEGPGEKVVAVGFAAGGRELLTVDGDGTVSFWDRSGKRLASLYGQDRRTSSSVTAVAVERHLLATVHTAGVLRLIDTGKRQALAELEVPAGERYASVALSPDLKLVAAVAEGGLTLFDVESRKPLHKFEGTHEGKRRPLTSAAFHPDGKSVVAGSSEGDLFFWDLTTRQLTRRESWPHIWAIRRLAYSADGRLLACADGSGPVELRTSEPGKPGIELLSHTAGIHKLVFRPDGRTLVSTSADRTTCLWETTTTSLRLKRDAFGIETLSAAFSPDGRTLLTGGDDGTAVLWDATGRWLLDDGKPPGAEERTTLWADLGTRDGERAYRAMARLAADDEVVDLVRGAVKRADLGQIESLIKDLDSDDFRARESGSRGLEALGESAAARLRSELSKTDSVEVKVRIQALLDRLESGSASPERLRQLRAIEVLEMNGSPAALRLLEDLAKGSPQAWPTDDAVAAVKRLKMRQ